MTSASLLGKCSVSCGGSRLDIGAYDHNSKALKVKAKPTAQKHDMKCSMVSVFACTIS